jgi:hypothetical protein
MSYQNIDFNVLETVVRALPSVFQTKDVSEHPVMLRAHGAESMTRNYHADVGRALSAHHVALGVQDQHRKGARGTTWRKAPRKDVPPVGSPHGDGRGAPATEESPPDLPPRGAVADVDAALLARVVTSQRRTFATKDVSEDPRMKAGHPALTGHPNYHAFIGRALSIHRESLGIDELRKGSNRGSIWEKSSATTNKVTPTSAPPRVPSGLQGDAAELGPQYAGDSTFTARMRRHQSWYRAHVLKVPYGPGPTANEARLLGNMLTPADGQLGRNFVTPAIGELALERVRRGGGAVEPYRLLHNMLSSQPMCFNLFAPLALDLTLARDLVGVMVPETIAAVTRVDLEWAPIPSDEYLGDRTAFDAAIEYVTTAGERCLLGIETKLTEPFSPGEYERESYRRWTNGPRSPWRPEVRATLHRSRTNQLWRDHLLAVALRDHPRSDLATARLLVVHHPLDRDCQNVLEHYRGLLNDGDDSFRVCTLDALIGRWRGRVGTAEQRAWLDALTLRYLDLERSGA